MSLCTEKAKDTDRFYGIEAYGKQERESKVNIGFKRYRRDGAASDRPDGYFH